MKKNKIFFFSLQFFLSFTINVIATETKTTAKVVPETWTEDFASALECAKSEHRPLLLFTEGEKCIFCSRIRAIVNSTPFKNWIKGSKIYLCNAHYSEKEKSSASANAIQFTKSSPQEPPIVGLPYIGIFWPKSSNDEIRTAFSGRRGNMPGVQDTLLTVEFISALENILSDYFKSIKGRQPIAEICKNTVKLIRVSCQGEGHVEMYPLSGELKSTSKPILLKAKPKKRRDFIGWRGPDGKFILSKRLTLKVSYDMADGTYTAVFAK